MLTAMERIRNSWELAKVSWSVLRSDKALAVFPALSAVVGLIVLGIFAGLVAVTGVNNTHGTSLRGIGYVFIVLAYIGLAFVTTYFLGALVHGANEALEGRRAELGECFGGGEREAAPPVAVGGGARHRLDHHPRHRGALRVRRSAHRQPAGRGVGRS